MDQTEIRLLVEDYIRNHLSIELVAKTVESYEEHGSKYMGITVKVKLDRETITEDYTSFCIK